MMKKIILFTTIFINSLVSAQQTDNALYFGTGSYINIDQVAPEIVNLNAFTIDFWISNNFGSPSGESFISFNTSSSGNLLTFRMNYTGEPDSVVVINLNENGTEYEYFGSNQTLRDSNCHHLALTYNNGEIHAYVDGVEEISCNHSLDFSPDDWVSIGCEKDSPSNFNQYYDGIIENFRIWNYDLSQPVIEALYLNAEIPSENKLLLHFDFNVGLAGNGNTNIVEVESDVPPYITGDLIGFNLYGPTSNFVLDPCNNYDGLLSTEENMLSGVNIYPNPSSGIFTVETPLSSFQYQVYNTVGQEVLSGQATHSYLQLDLAGYESGVYILNVISEGGERVSYRMVRE